ncbi:hypothetical protein ELAN111203_18380 [Elizabethkingia anophelis]
MKNINVTSLHNQLDKLRQMVENTDNKIFDSFYFTLGPNR